MRLFHNELTTEFPDEWEDRTMITLAAPFRPGEFATNVVMTKHIVEPTQSLESFVQEQSQMLAEALPDFEILDYRINQINGFPGCQQLHRFNSENGMIQQVQTFILANRCIYAITGTSILEKFDESLEAFRRIVENFEISEN